MILSAAEGLVAAEREIRADYDRDTIAIYQAYSLAIANQRICQLRAPRNGG